MQTCKWAIHVCTEAHCIRNGLAIIRRHRGSTRPGCPSVSPVSLYLTEYALSLCSRRQAAARIEIIITVPNGLLNFTKLLHLWTDM